MSNNNYPLDEKALEEQYADLLLKIALKEYLKEQALQMKQQEAEAAPAPQPAQKSSNVVAVAFRQVGWQETKETLLHGLKKVSPEWRWCFWRPPLPLPQPLPSPRWKGRKAFWRR